MKMPASTLARFAAALLVGFASIEAAQAGPYSALYVFGDSLSDSGNDYIITSGQTPVGTVYTDGPNSGRFTNGLNYVDLLASSLGVSLTPSVNGGTDYAYGGARTTTNILAPSGFPALSFNGQLGAYYGNHAAADPNALYVLWIGSNDMADAIGAAAQGNSAAIPTAISTTLTGIGNAIGGLASLGAKHFLVPNVPDLSLIPRIRSFNSAGLSFLAQSASVSYDQNLATLLAQPSFSSLDIHGLDTFAALTQITANPAAYGLSNVTSACYTGEVNGTALPGGPAPSVCANPSSYLYFDYEHPSAALHAQLAQRAFAAVVPEPASWALMLLGGAGLMASRRRAGRRR